MPIALRGSTPKTVRFTAMGRRDAHRLYWMAREYDRVTKRGNGCQGGALGTPALKVLEALIFDFMNYQTGRLDPSYEGIAKRANICASAVAAALKKLQTLGIVRWIRRCLVVRNEGNGRLERKQKTNAYSLRPCCEWRGFQAPDETPPPPAATWGKPERMPSVLEVAVIEQRSSRDLRSVVRVLETGDHRGIEAALAGLGRALLEAELPDSTP
jgi:hypothetical protein